MTGTIEKLSATMRAALTAIAEGGGNGIHSAYMLTEKGLSNAGG